VTLCAAVDTARGTVQDGPIPVHPPRRLHAQSDGSARSRRLKRRTVSQSWSEPGDLC